MTICKSFIRLHLDYSDIAYDQSTNDLVKNRKVQYNAALVITGAIKGTSRKKLFKDLGLESLKLSRKLRGLCTFYKKNPQVSLPLYLGSCQAQRIHNRPLLNGVSLDLNIRCSSDTTFKNT